MASTLVRDCPRCGSRSQTFDIQSIYIVDASDCEVPAVCRACGKGVIFVVWKSDFRGFSGGTSYRSIADNGYDLTDRLSDRGYVSVAHHNVQEPPEHLPPEIERVFREAAACYAIGCWNAAGAMFRTCVDLATKSMLPTDGDETIKSHQRRNLAARLKWLFDSGCLSKDLEPLADVIREDANDGVHEGTLSKGELEDLQDFTIEFLRKVYTTPERIRLAEERKAARRAPSKEGDREG